MIKKIVLWVVTILWASTIFHFSAQPASESKVVSQGVVEKLVNLLPCAADMTQAEKDALADSLHKAVRKTAHFCIYAVLGVCIFSLLISYHFAFGGAFWRAVILGGLYAVSDEVHQLFVPGRSGEVADVLLDTCGVSIGALFILVILFIWKKYRTKCM